MAEINTVVGEIANGAQEQSIALQQINTAVEQMSSTTQANAAMVEESSAAGHSLSEESSKLAQAVAAFKLKASNNDNRLRAELAKVAPHAFRSEAARAKAKAS